MSDLTPFYNTQSSTLAALLELCGCQHPYDEQGKQIVCSNTFTKESLRNLTENGRPLYAGKGMGAEQCAIDAHKRGLEGIVLYHFVQSDEQREICKGWEEMMDSIAMQAEADKKAGLNPDRQVPMDQLNISHTQIGRLFCLYKKTSKDMFKRKRMIRPSLALMEFNTESTGDRKTRITGSGKIRSLKL